MSDNMDKWKCLEYQRFVDSCFSTNFRCCIRDDTEALHVCNGVFLHQMTELKSLKGNCTELVIIGNGFDQWQGLSISCDQFKDYYRRHIHSVVKELRIKASVDDTGALTTPVELIVSEKEKEMSKHTITWGTALDKENILHALPVRRRRAA